MIKISSENMNSYSILLGYYKVATSENFQFGSATVIPAIPSVYPDHGQSLIGEANIIDFNLTYNYGNRQYIQGFEREIYDEIISFSQK